MDEYNGAQQELVRYLLSEQYRPMLHRAVSVAASLGGITLGRSATHQGDRTARSRPPGAGCA